MEHTGPLRGCAIQVGPREAALELRAVLEHEMWQCEHFGTAVGVLQRLRAGDTDVVLLTPGEALRPHTELCRQIKFDRRTAFVPVVFVLSPAHAQSHADVFAAGADDCIQLPASFEEIAVRLVRALRAKRGSDSAEDATAIVCSLANAIEGRDSYTRGHVERVATYCEALGRRLGLGEEMLRTLKIGGMVHDIGKVAVPDQILNKAGRLTDEEMEIVRRHPVVGYDILASLRTFRDVLPMVRWHHERPNGSGYPDGLSGEDLPLLPQIVAVADVFDALSTARSYRPACAPTECRKVLTRCGEKGELDPRLVAELCEVLNESAVGLGDGWAECAAAQRSVAGQN